MIVFSKDNPIVPANAVGNVVYLWAGKVRWLPHIGPAYLIIGCRNGHLIGRSLREGASHSHDRTYIQPADVAICCDPYEEHEAIQQINMDRLRAHCHTDEYYARVLNNMSADDIKRCAEARRIERPRAKPHD